MEQETYAALPIEMNAYGQADQRRATDFAYLMPGVQGNETNGNATTNTGVVNGSGSRGAVSDVYVDGIPFVRAGGNGDPRYVWTAISVDAVDQFQVQTVGYGAMYEGQGLMNYSIKHGGNQFHGSVYEFFRNTALDTWGWFGKIPNQATGLPVKPVEHNNEYGVVIGGPLIPFGSLKQKLFFFTNYDGFRYSSATPTPMRFPSNKERTGDFSADGVAIYDPSTEATCASFNTGGKPCRYQYGYGPTGTPGAFGNPKALGPGSPINVIPSSQLSAVAKNMQAFLPNITSDTTSSNYVAANATGLSNWSTTSRIDFVPNSRDTLTVLSAVGRQASSIPVGQTTAGRNVGPLPYDYGQAYAPKTAVWTVEETHVFSPNILNQAKWGYARYNGPTFNPNDAPNYAATTMGMSGLPTGQASNMFPFVTFAGTAAPTNWNGATENRTTAENYTFLDNLQWNVGKHSFTFGGNLAWMLYNVNNATKGGSTPITLAAAVTETAQLNNAFTASTGTGLSYASFLLGQIDKGSFTQYLQQEFGARFRAISPYVQDDWKMTNKLTVNLGLRYDFYPTITEVHNAESFFNPTLANPVTGLNGALAYTGSGAGTCNCSTPANNYYKNFGPRVGFAYQLDPKTVIRASYGVMFSHGGAVGGLNTSIGTLGFSAAPAFGVNGSDVTTMPGLLAGGSGAIPAFTGATGVASGPAYGTGFLKVASQGATTGTPSSMTYDDPYYGGRAPEFENWSFGIQQQMNNAMALNITYVGSEGHFLQLDSFHARGFQANDLDPKYLYLGTHLSDTGTTSTTVTADCANAANGISCPGLSNFATNQSLSTLLKPFPFQTPSDNFGYVGNANYHALQAMLSMRTWRGLTMNANYVWARAIDDGGTFRTGYPIPAGTLANHPSTSYPADRIERTVSTSNQPQHFVATGVWAWPFGKTVLSSGAVERAILGGFSFSGVYQAYSGSPLAITTTTCQTNPADSTCNATLNPNFSGVARQNGKWGKGQTWATYNATTSATTTAAAGPMPSSTYIMPSNGGQDKNTHAILTAPTGPFISSSAPVNSLTSSLNTEVSILSTGGGYDYTFGDAPRTAPYNISGPGNYQLDFALVRSFPLHLGESSKLDFRAEWYNVTNHTLFAVASTVVGNANFGQVTQSGNLNRKSAQFSARISF
jgi:hypothetical protein